jgi:hypothetical protein
MPPERKRQISTKTPPSIKNHIHNQQKKKKKNLYFVVKKTCRCTDSKYICKYISVCLSEIKPYETWSNHDKNWQEYSGEPAVFTAGQKQTYFFYFFWGVGELVGMVSVCGVWWAFVVRRVFEEPGA